MDTATTEETMAVDWDYGYGPVDSDGPSVVRHDSYESMLENAAKASRRKLEQSPNLDVYRVSTYSKDGPRSSWRFGGYVSAFRRRSDGQICDTVGNYA